MAKLRFHAGALAVAVLGGVALGCDGSSPTAPTQGAGGVPASGLAASASSASAAASIGVVTAAPDGSTLKALAPEPRSPKDGVVVQTLTPTLTVGSAQGRHVSATAFQHFFELYEIGGGGATTLVDSATVPQGASTTSYTVTNSLRQGVSHQWRTRAMHQEAVGPWSDWAVFETAVLLILSPPLPKTPIHGDTVGSLRPTLVLINGEVEGPGTVYYEFEVATDSRFQNVVAIRSAEKGAGTALLPPQAAPPGIARSHRPEQRTSVKLDFDLEEDTLYYWRGRATNEPVASTPLQSISGGRGAVTSAYSVVESFRTPGAFGVDAIDLSTVTFLHHNVSGWPITSTITSVSIGDPPICINHTKSGQWGSITVSGVKVEGNPWVIAKVGGTWYAGTYEWNRVGQTCKSIDAKEIGPHVDKSPLSSWRPKSGEQIGLMVSGPARTGPKGTQERSQVVMTTWP